MTKISKYEYHLYVKKAFCYVPDGWVDIIMGIVEVYISICKIKVALGLNREVAHPKLTYSIKWVR